MLPFTLLLSRNLKRSMPRIAIVAAFILVMRLVDLVWLVAPSVQHAAAVRGGAHAGGFPIHWMDIAIPIGLTAVWLVLFTRQLRSRTLFPHNDPYFKEAFAHEAH
jgi:hypothetical protein